MGHGGVMGFYEYRAHTVFFITAFLYQSETIPWNSCFKSCFLACF